MILELPWGFVASITAQQPGIRRVSGQSQWDITIVVNYKRIVVLACVWRVAEEARWQQPEAWRAVEGFAGGMIIDARLNGSA